MIDIYYLDDEPALCYIFEQTFMSEDVKVTTFTSAEEAISTTESNPPKAIFIDMRLEDTTGNHVAEKISDDVIKYLVTGDLINTSDYPFKEVITKPYDFAYVQSLIDGLKE